MKKGIYMLKEVALSGDRNVINKVKGKSKVIPLQARCGPEGG